MKSVLLDLKRTIRQSESESSSILTRIATDMDAIRKQIPIIVPIPNSNLESVVANTSVVNSNQEAKATITEKERQLLEKFNELHTLFFHIITLKSTTAVSAIKNIKVLGNTVNDTLDSKNINVAKLKSEINQLLNDRNLENTLQIITQIQITLSQIREDTTQAYEHWKTRHLTEAHTKRVESGNLNKTQGDYYIKLLNLVDEMLKLDSAIRGEVSGNVAGERSNVSSQPSATA